jgi:hypothetical protein
MYDAWYELASCTALYDAVRDESVTEAWLELVFMFAVLDGQPNFAAELNTFVPRMVTAGSSCSQF